jgi:actin-related protein
MQPAFVVDCGTSQCRAGLATMKLLPSFVCDTVVGKEKTEAASAVQKAEAAMAGLAGMATAKAPVWIGEELADLGDSLDMVYPMSNGRITDWVRNLLKTVHSSLFELVTRVCPGQDSADRLLHAVVASKLGIKLDEHPVFFVEQPLAVRNDREKYVSMLFESFSAPAVFLASSAVTSLYANNMTSGLVVSCGGRCATH